MAGRTRKSTSGLRCGWWEEGRTATVERMSSLIELLPGQEHWHNTGMTHTHTHKQMLKGCFKNLNIAAAKHKQVYKDSKLRRCCDYWEKEGKKDRGRERERAGNKNAEKKGGKCCSLSSPWLPYRAGDHNDMLIMIHYDVLLSFRKQSIHVKLFLFHINSHDLTA